MVAPEEGHRIARRRPAASCTDACHAQRIALAGLCCETTWSSVRRRGVPRIMRRGFRLGRFAGKSQSGPGAVQVTHHAKVMRRCCGDVSVFSRCPPCAQRACEIASGGGMSSPSLPLGTVSDSPRGFLLRRCYLGI